jgi:hypothetical protein
VTVFPVDEVIVPVKGVLVLVIVMDADADGLIVDVMAEAPLNVIGTLDTIVPAKPVALPFNVNAPAVCVNVPTNEPLVTSNEAVPLEAIVNVDAAEPATIMAAPFDVTVALNAEVGAIVNAMPLDATNEPLNDPAVYATVAVATVVTVLATSAETVKAAALPAKPPFNVIAPEYDPAPVNVSEPPAAWTNVPVKVTPATAFTVNALVPELMPETEPPDWI